jgi:hypothetical protein
MGFLGYLAKSGPGPAGLKVGKEAPADISFNAEESLAGLQDLGLSERRRQDVSPLKLDDLRLLVPPGTAPIYQLYKNHPFFDTRSPTILEFREMLFQQYSGLIIPSLHNKSKWYFMTGLFDVFG